MSVLLVNFRSKKTCVQLWVYETIGLSNHLPVRKPYTLSNIIGRFTPNNSFFHPKEE